jgi:hypothetical protein
LIVRQGFHGEETRQDVDIARQKPSPWTKLAFRAFLSPKLFTPLPPNDPFLAYGLTAMEWKPITMPCLLELGVREPWQTGERLAGDHP